MCLLGVLEVHNYNVSLQHHMLSKLYITFFCNFSRWDLKLFKVSFGLSQFCASNWRHYRSQNVYIWKQKIRWGQLGCACNPSKRETNNLRMNWWQEVCYNSLHSLTASTLGWSPWRTQGWLVVEEWQLCLWNTPCSAQR